MYKYDARMILYINTTKDYASMISSFVSFRSMMSLVCYFLLLLLSDHGGVN